MTMWLIPPHLSQGGEDWLRARLVAYVWAGLLPPALFALLTAILEGESLVTAVVGLGIVYHLLVGAALRWWGSRIGGHLMCAGMVSTLLAIAIGRSETLPLAALAVPMLIAVAALRGREILLWTGVGVGIIALVGGRHLILGVPATGGEHVARVTTALALVLVLSVAALGFGLRQVFAAALAQVRSGQSKLEVVFERAAVGLILIDRHGRIERANAAAVALLGVLDGRLAEEVLPTDFLVYDGRALEIERAAFSNGRQLAVVTDRSAIEERERLLEDARDAAIEASEAKSRFLANMSHELRTPLNAIIGYSEILAETLEDAGDSIGVADADRIRSSGRHLLGVIDDVLDLARVEAGQLDLRSEAMDLEGLTRKVAQDVSGRLAVGVSLTVEAEPMGSLLGDPFRVRQVLNNLLTNAVKFTPSGHIVVRISEQTDGVEIQVEDTGIGMDKAALRTLFERFGRASDTHVQGTGLGMAIVHELVTAMRGTIEVDSALGVGTRFVVHLPLRPAIAESAG